VRGPMSALYGNDAMTGVVNLITKKGTGPPTLGISSGLGKHREKSQIIGEHRVSFLGEYKNFAYSMAYSRIDDPGILPFNNRFASNVFNGRFDFTPFSNLSFTFSSLLIDTFSGFPTTGSGDRFSPLDPLQNQAQFRLLQGLTTKYQPLSWWENELTVYYTSQDLRYNNYANPVNFFSNYLTRDLERHIALDYHSNFLFNLTNNVRTTSTIGYSGRREQLKSQVNSDFGFGPNTSFLKSNRSSSAFYFQEQLGFWERLFLRGGFRFEDNRVFLGQEFSPRGSGALRFPETGTTLRAAGGRAIKEPTFIETSSSNPYYRGNPNLKPEKNTSWEVGLDQSFWQGRLKGGLTYFENHFKDFITFLGFPFSTFENIGAVRTTGLEFFFAVKPGYGLTLRGAYTHLFQFHVLDDNQGQGGLYFRTGYPILRRPRHTFSFDVNYTYDRLNVNLNGLFNGARADSFFDTGIPPFGAPVRVTSGDYFLLNLAASYDVLRDLRPAKALQLWVRVDNLLNTNYMQVYGYSSPRLSVVGGVKVVFQ
jgi:vitamin B12 transporter